MPSKPFLFFLACVSLLCSAFSHAQNASTDIQRIVEELRNGSELDFHFRMIQSGDTIFSTRGTMLMKNDNFRLRYESYDVCYDGERLSYYDVKESTLTLLAPLEEEMARLNPILHFARSITEYKMDYLPTNDKNRRISLLPVHEDSVYREIVVTLDADAGAPIRIEVTSSDYIQSEIEIIRNKQREDLSSRHFLQRAEQYPNSEIIDLR